MTSQARHPLYNTLVEYERTTRELLAALARRPGSSATGVQRTPDSIMESILHIDAEMVKDVEACTSSAFYCIG